MADFAAMFRHAAAGDHPWDEAKHSRDGHGRFARIASRAAHIQTTERTAGGAAVHSADAPRLVSSGGRGGLFKQGVNTTEVFADEHGDKWVFKHSPGHAGDDRVEYAANTLARAWGFPTAEAHLTTIDGQTGVVQRMHPDVVRDLNVDFDGEFFVDRLNRDQLSYLAAEHVLDWALGNADAHGGNFVVQADGTIRGIDKGLAFLRTDPTNRDMWQDVGQVYTDTLGHAAQGYIDQEDMAAMRTAAVDAAHRIQAMPDEQMRGALEGMLGQGAGQVETLPPHEVAMLKADWPALKVTPGGHLDPEGVQQLKRWGIDIPLPGDAPDYASDPQAERSRREWVQGWIDRKNRIVEDTNALWDGIEEQAGW